MQHLIILANPSSARKINFPEWILAREVAKMCKMGQKASGTSYFSRKMAHLEEKFGSPQFPIICFAFSIAPLLCKTFNLGWGRGGEGCHIRGPDPPLWACIHQMIPNFKMVEIMPQISNPALITGFLANDCRCLYECGFQKVGRNFQS